MNTGPQHSVEVPYGWVVIIASLLLNSIGLGAPNILFVVLKPIAADLGTDRWVPSLAYSLMMIGAGVGGIAMGWWMDRKGIIYPVMFGSVMIATGAFMVSWSETMWGLWVANGLLIGLLGKSAMIAPLIANATRWFDRRRGLAVAIIASGQGLSGAVWPSLIGATVAVVGWRETYFWYAVFSLATMVPLAWLIRHRPPTPPPGRIELGGSADGLVLGWSPARVQIMLWLAVVGCCTAMSMPVVHLVSHVSDLGYSPVRGAEMLSVLMVAGFVSRIGFGILADRIGAVPTLLIASACQMVMLGVFAVVEGLVALYVAALLFGLGFAGIMPCYPLLLRLWFPVGQMGWRIAAQYLFGALGMALGGWMAGQVFDLTGSYSPAFVLGMLFNLLNFGLVWTLHLREAGGRFSPRPT